MNLIKLFTICFCFCVNQLHAQSSVWDSTHRPDSYQLKVNQFKSFKKSKQDIIFLGNSISAGTDWSELLQIPEAKNRGISGDITFGVLERLDDIIAGQPAKVFVLIGINDISRNIPDDIILCNYEKIIDRIQKGSSATEIYFQTLLPVNETFNKFKNHYGKDEHILYVNQGLKKLTQIKNVQLIDLYPAFLDSNKCLKANYTYDGLHLTIDGYKAWAELLKEGGYL
ncbi:sialate O-acetylesterase [Olivibacter sp. SDN3]|uniref:GDSL-type esterase/lipase family protein n=1 Tax=Olivibacter sp. SDN3 TaxID=2764720 RepID=UPI001651AC57|nr:GDSL-type esterase/lipase family protein [Olivibacter sp. SDN3]QNL49194.1 sialate O-acetylesterase [Olivibacter sp. SDN3]